MIHERAHLTIKPGTQAAFEAGVKKAMPLFLRAKGCQRVQLLHVIEHADQYILEIYWETLDDHMVHFRASEDFQTWRGLVSAYFAAPPEVVHTETVLSSAD